MKIKIIPFLITFVAVFYFSSLADEGMWIPSELSKNYTEMQKLGLKINLEQLYDVNKPSLKDAIVMLDYGSCTGEIISAEGLLLTNHHCGYGDVQSLSSVSNDYLTNGYWAGSKEEELPCPAKTVSFLERIENVTDKILSGITNETPTSERTQKISEGINKIQAAASENGKFDATVYTMLNGNEFYLYVYKTYKDIRLVGVPPSAIGKFGGDTDNWMWPRHTGDFCIFRVYAGKDGEPAEYSKDNVPYKPKHFLPVSIKGYSNNDFAMIWGFPGSTDRYLTSYGVQQKMTQTNPASVKLKSTKMAIMKDYMDKSDKIRIQYAEKYAYLANFWKKDLEETKALKKLKVVEDKRKIEDSFNSWANETPDKAKIYGTVIKDFEDLYKERVDGKFNLLTEYFYESTFSNGAEILTYAYQNSALLDSLETLKVTKDYIGSLRESNKAHFKDNNQDIDKKILTAMLRAYYTDLPKELLPDIFKTIDSKYGNNFEKFADDVYKNSIFASEEKFNNFLNNPSSKVYREDLAFTTMVSLLENFLGMRKSFSKNSTKLNITKRLFLAGLKEMNPEINMYPDANSSMRVTYGKVFAYDPRDAVHYDYTTYLEGVMEKEDPTNEEFIVPEKLKTIFDTKDFGQYSVGDKMPVCFLTDNDITGGNSGSPVLNGNGELIGLAFDGNSEAMSSDLKFDPKLQRTINVDIRYVLLIIDKFAGAQRIINELNLIK